MLLLISGATAQIIREPGGGGGGKPPTESSPLLSSTSPVLGEWGELCAGENTVIESMTKCADAAMELGLEDTTVEPYNNWAVPKGCYHTNNNGRLFFNAATYFKANSNTRPICMGPVSTGSGSGMTGSGSGMTGSGSGMTAHRSDRHPPHSA